MSQLWAVLPSLGARSIQQTLDRVAREAASGDPRTMDQRRADALVELVTGDIDPPATVVHVVVPASVLDGTSEQPGWLPGVGPITAGSCSRWRRLRADWTRGLPPPARRPCQWDAERHQRAAVPTLSGPRAGCPCPRRHMQVPRMPAIGAVHWQRDRPRPHGPLARRQHIRGEPGGTVPAPPPVEAHTGMVGRAAPGRVDDLDHADRASVQLRALELPRPRRRGNGGQADRRGVRA